MANSDKLKDKLLVWSKLFTEVVWLDSNGYQTSYKTYESVLAVDALTMITTEAVGGFEKLKNYRNEVNDWVFGYLSYDLKNDTEPLLSSNYDGLGFPDLFFFQPKKLLFLAEDHIEFHYLEECAHEIDADFASIKQPIVPENTEPSIKSSIQARVSKENYEAKVGRMQELINVGYIYEANFCMEFYSENRSIDPIHTFQKLNAISEPPFATYLKCNDKYLLSASPERYISRKGDNVFSQPIKGTKKRGATFEEDSLLISQLIHDEKERAENIMIVDLVRNDLSHYATKGSVSVAELCKVYTFKQVHQLISTVEAQLRKDTDSVDLIKSTFPMGSMTGAPKLSAMKIIEDLEETKRGLYSGAVGYIAPNGDFDFNVVIRSILYNETSKYVSFSVGSAITSLSVPENEYEECLLKAKAMRQILEM